MSVVFAPGPTSNYQWVAAGPNPCPRCTELDGEIRSLSTWYSSIVPGFHKHCHCKLTPVNEPASGMVFSCQAPYLTMTDILNAISALFTPLQAERFHHHHLFDEPEGVSDIVPYVPTHADIIEAITPEFDWSTAQPNED
jgi:hypothetical protein